MIAVQKHAISMAEVAVMNRDEAELISGTEDLEEALHALAELGPGIIAVTGGEEGTSILSDGVARHLPARQQTVTRRNPRP